MMITMTKVTIMISLKLQFLGCCTIKIKLFLWYLSNVKTHCLCFKAPEH